MSRAQELLYCLALLACAVATAGAQTNKGDCQQARYHDNPQWNNQSFAAQRGVFSLEFDVTPSLAGIRSAVVISDGPTTGRSNAPVMILFSHEENKLQVRKIGATPDPKTGRPPQYAADRALKYTAGAPHHLRVVMDVPKQSFSVYATLPGAAEQALAVDYPMAKFEKTQGGVVQLNNIAVSLQAHMKQPAAATITLCQLALRAGR